MTKQEAENIRRGLLGKVVIQRGTESTRNRVSQVDVEEINDGFDVTIQLADDNGGVITVKGVKEFEQTYAVKG